MGVPAAPYCGVDWVLWRAQDRVEVERRAHQWAAADPERVIRWCVAFAPLIAGARIARGDDRQLPLLRELADSV